MGNTDPRFVIFGIFCLNDNCRLQERIYIKINSYVCQMKKVLVALVPFLLFFFWMSGLAAAQENLSGDPTGEELQEIEQQYESEEDPEPPPPVDMGAMFGGEEAGNTGEVPATEGTGGVEAIEEPEMTEEEVMVPEEEVVNTYEAEEAENGKMETEECTLWSCALFKMIIGVAAIGGSALWVFMLVDVLKLGKDAFPGGKEYRKWLWFAGVFLFWVIGAAVYYLEIFRKHHVK
jgi:hypothetical protein